MWRKRLARTIKCGVWIYTLIFFINQRALFAENGKIAGLDVSLLFQSIPIRWSYLEATRMQGTVNGNFVTPIDATFGAKSESFRQLSGGLRIAKISQLTSEFSAGIEVGFGFPVGGKTFSFSAGRVNAPNTAGSTVTFSDPSNLAFSLEASTMDAVSKTFEIKSMVFPLLVKGQFSMPLKRGKRGQVQFF